MNFLAITFVCLLGVIFVLSTFYYVRSQLSIRIKSIFIILKASMIVILALCFFEPVFNFKRLAPKNSSIPVLIDASLSMSLFSPESSVIPLLQKLKKNPSFQLYSFGDTLRALHNQNFSFNDAHSNLPNPNDPLFHNSQNFIILSDANLTNKDLSLAEWNDKSVFYTQLPSIHMKPFLRSSVSFLESVPSDSTNILTVRMDGYSTVKNQLIVTLFDNSKECFSDSRSIDSGNVNSLLTIKIPHLTTGKHLFRLAVRSAQDSLNCENFFIQHILPNKFYFSFHNSSPDINKRFFTLALQSEPDFVLKSLPNQKADLYCIFSNDNSKIQFNSISKTGVIVFLGCAPCPTEPKVTGTRFLLSKPINAPVTPIDQINISDIPLPLTFFECTSQQTNIQSLITGSFTDNQSKSIPILYTCDWEKHRCVILNTKDFWKWDFLPLAADRSEDQSFYFSQHLIALIKEILLTNSSNEFRAFPANISEYGDSVTVGFSFPSEIPVSSECKVIMSLYNVSTHSKFDTTLKVITNSSQLQYSHINLPQSGKYFYKCDLIQPSGTFTYADTFMLQHEKAELMIKGQNQALLNQFAREVKLDNDAAIENLQKMLRSNNHPLIQERFQISQSWLLLVLFFLLFILEIVLLRKYTEE